MMAVEPGWLLRVSGSLGSYQNSVSWSCEFTSSDGVVNAGLRVGCMAVVDFNPVSASLLSPTYGSETPAQSVVDPQPMQRAMAFLTCNSGMQSTTTDTSSSTQARLLPTCLFLCSRESSLGWSYTSRTLDWSPAARTFMMCAHINGFRVRSQTVNKLQPQHPVVMVKFML